MGLKLPTHTAEADNESAPGKFPCAAVHSPAL